MNKQSQFRILEEGSYQLVVRENGRIRARKGEHMVPRWRLCLQVSLMAELVIEMSDYSN